MINLLTIKIKKLNMLQSNKEQKEFVIIDGSWYIFCKYYATISYFKQKNKDKNIELGNPTIWASIENKEFLDDFKVSFLETIKKLDETLNINNPTVIVGKDCKRKNIWRMELYKKYKSNRKNHPHLSSFFKLAYEQLYKDAGVNKILTHDKLEADDCIALYTEHLITEYPNCKIKIMTTDADYFQLIRPNVEIIKPEKRKELTDPYTFISTNINNCNPKEQLFCKILSGDKSDNIPNIFRGCGQKTALKFYKDKQSFEEILKNEDIKKIYELNKEIIDMNNIPDNLKKEFYKKNLSNKSVVLKEEFIIKRLYKLRPRKYVNGQLKYRDNPYYNFRTTNYINYSNKKQKCY